MIPVGWSVAAGSALAASVLLGLYVDAKSDLKAQQVAHNAQIEQMADRGELEAANARVRALQRESAQKQAIIEGQRQALGIASQAASEAASRPAEVREVIREVIDEHACLGADVPAAVLDSLRD